MNNALFFRKCSSSKMLKWNYDNIPEFGQILEYKIVAIKSLNSSDYNYFSNNFLKKFDFIDNLKNKLIMDESDCVHCILVKSNSSNGILVYPAGYSYARYVAFYKPIK